MIATKVGEEGGLGAANIQRDLDASLRRLHTDYVDLYYAHWDDPETEFEETLTAFDDAIREGKVRYIAASNHSAPRLQRALEVAKSSGLRPYVALQTHYNLMERDRYECELADLCAREGLPCLPYYSLAQGFLTGKYRSTTVRIETPRAAVAASYRNGRGRPVLDALENTAQARETTIPAVALAWLLAQPTVVATVASARSSAQLAELLPAAELELNTDELNALDLASAQADTELTSGITSSANHSIRSR